MLPDSDLAAYRRDGFVVLRAIMTAEHVAACLAALGRLAEEPRHGETFVALEAGAETQSDPVDRVRKFGKFTETDPALMRAAMNPVLHQALDQLMGSGRVMLQEMALVKPPRIGGEKPWHQDAAYFRGSDPGLMFGVWIALDPATTENGCMELIPGSHLAGPAPHIPHPDINLCTIDPRFVQAGRRVAVPLDLGDALVFHSLTHHYTAANRSGLRRRALQFHYHQLGMEWTSLEAHRVLYHDEAGEYAGCTVPRGQPFCEESSFLPHPLRPVVLA